MNINNKTRKILNVNQNDLIRYMTGLSRNRHITTTSKLLKNFNINDLYFYMKLIFVKNLKNNSICYRIFNYLLYSDYKNNTCSFIKEFKTICYNLNLDEDYVINNIE